MVYKKVTDRLGNSFRKITDWIDRPLKSNGGYEKSAQRETFVGLAAMFFCLAAIAGPILLSIIIGSFFPLIILLLLLLAIFFLWIEYLFSDE